MPATTRSHAKPPWSWIAALPLGDNLAIPIIGVVGAAFGPFVLLVGWWNWDDEAWTFAKTPNAFLWFALIAGQTALWAFLYPIITRAIAEIDDDGLSLWGWISAFVVFAVPVAVVSLIGRKVAHADYSLPHHVLRVGLLTIVGFVVAFTAVVGIWRLSRKAGTVRPADADALATFLRLRVSLEQLLGAVGAVIGAAVLATGALRGAIDAAHKVDAKQPETFDVGYVLLYGAGYSALVALIYAPAYLRMAGLGRAIVDHAAPLPAADDATFRDRYALRKDLTELMRLDVGPSASFKAGVAILAPLATSLVGILIGSQS